MKKGKRPPTRIIHSKDKGRVINIQSLIGHINISGPLEGEKLRKALESSMTGSLKYLDNQ